MIYDFIDYMQSLSHNVCDLCHCFFFCNSHNKIHTHTHTYIYIYIYRVGFKLHHRITFYRIHILKISPLNYMSYMFLIFIPIFMSIGCYLPFDP